MIKIEIWNKKKLIVLIHILDLLLKYSNLMNMVLNFKKYESIQEKFDLIILIITNHKNNYQFHHFNRIKVED